GGEANALSDQFAFCVALYEGLYGVRPFAGESMAALAFNMNRQRFTAPPLRARVPVWLGRLVRRGLAREPERRYPSMEALLAALIQGAARRRIRRAGLWAAGLVVAGGGLSYALVPSPTPCRGGEDRLRTVWNDERAAAIASAFEATGLPYADEVHTRAQQRLDDYAEAWVGVYTEVCEATAIHERQTPAELDRRIACLDERLAELDALLQVLGEADDRVAEHAAQAASELRAPGTCTEALAERAESTDPERQRQVDTLRGRLLRAEALEHAGRYEDAASLSQEIAAEAELLDEPRLHGEALVQLGAAEDGAGEYAAAAEHLGQAYFLANEAGHDRVAAQAAVALISVEGVHLAHGEEGLAWARHAEAALERSDPKSLLRGRYHAAMGSLHMLRSEFEPAREHFEQAIAIERAALGEDHERVATLLAHLGTVQEQAGRSEDAIASFEKALEITRRALGPEHPQLSLLHNNYAVVLYGRQDLRGAQAQLERALAIQREALGDHPLTATGIDNLGVMLLLQGEQARGRALVEEALAMREKVLAPDHPHVANSLANLAGILEHEQDFGGARRLYERARDILEKAYGPSNLQVARVIFSLGVLDLREGAIQRGHDACARALEIVDPQVAAEHTERMGPLACLGWAALELEQPQQALAQLERAHAMRALGQAEIPALTSLLLARALEQTGGDAERAHALRAEAREQYAVLGQPPPERLRAWLRDPSSLTPRGEPPKPQ
ncbi:MAG: tetratricopeptide repeat protein, partial [Myxococcales bacterium]|nr:tetratricopeptide repeat protein [Myxococcales bacterium]